MMRKPRCCNPNGTDPPALSGSREAPTTAIVVALSSTSWDDRLTTTSKPRHTWLFHRIGLLNAGLASLSGDAGQADDRDLTIRLGGVLAVLGRHACDPAQRLFPLGAGERLTADLHLPAADLEPEVIRVLDHVVEPGRA